MTTAHDSDEAVKEAVLRKLRLDIGKLDRDSSPDTIVEIIKRIADCGLDTLNVDRLLHTIKGQTSTSIRVLREQLGDAARTRRAAGREIEGMILDAYGNILPL